MDHPILIISNRLDGSISPERFVDTFCIINRFLPINNEKYFRSLDKCVCLFDLILYVPSTIFQLNRDGSSWVEPVLSEDKFVLLKTHSTVTPVRLEPAASRS